MMYYTKYSLRFLGAFLFCALMVLNSTAQHGESPEYSAYPAPVFTVDAQLALHALMSLSDAHLKKVADEFTLLATTDEMRAGKWERIREPLARLARRNIPAVYWFALPDGSYWTLDSGRVSGSLADRAYFPRLLAGQTVLGDLVVSRSTGRNTAIVAVPVRRNDNKLAGAIGCSIHLDSLSTLVKQELGGLPADLIFFSINSHPLAALNSNPELIFLDPLTQEDPGMKEAFRTILSTQEGVVTYTFRGARRTVLYRKSPLTGWWYAFGKVEQGAVYGNVRSPEKGTEAFIGFFLIAGYVIPSLLMPVINNGCAVGTTEAL